jgi:hypothetical protein
MSSQPDDKIQNLQHYNGASPKSIPPEMDEVEVFLKEEKLPEIT